MLNERVLPEDRTGGLTKESASTESGFEAGLLLYDIAVASQCDVILAKQHLPTSYTCNGGLLVQPFPAIYSISRYKSSPMVCKVLN